MPILKLNTGSGKVEVTEESKAVPELVAIKKADNHPGQPFYNSVITYAYYMYVSNGPYANFQPEKRDKRVCDVHLDGVKSTKFFKNPRARAFIKLYFETELSSTEQSFEKIKVDLDETIRKLHDIPFTKKVKVEIDVHIPEFLDSPSTVLYPVKEWVEFDNSDEKLKSLTAIDKILNTLDKLKKRVTDEASGKRKTVTRSMFDH